ncbi:MAG TPA: hypothetical protein VMH35_11415 [Streptosporangiaceae bacterium]|nr:hypothetical protein [Streptosporangiaceae bacterium]
MLLHGRSLTALRRACVVAAAAAIPLLAGCQAGLDAPVLHWHAPTAGASVSVRAARGPGFIAIRNVFVLGAPLTSSLPAGSSASVFLALVNTGAADRLVSISAPGTAASVTIPAGGVALPRSRLVLLTGPQPKVVLTGLTHTLQNGTDIDLVLRFQNAGSVRLAVPVYPRATDYATYSPPPSPSPTATAKHRHRGPAAIASPSPSASGTATP